MGRKPARTPKAVSAADEYRFFETGSWQLCCVAPRQGTDSIRAYAAFSPDSRVAAIASSAQQVRLLDPATGREHATLESRGPQNPYSTQAETSPPSVSLCQQERGDERRDYLCAELQQQLPR